MCILYPPDTVCDFGELVLTGSKMWGERGLCVRFLLENESREECGDFSGRIGSERILEN